MIYVTFLGLPSGKNGEILANDLISSSTLTITTKHPITYPLVWQYTSQKPN